MSANERPITAAYADVDPDAGCQVCGVGPRQWCRCPDGRERRVPCVARPRLRPPPVLCATDSDVNAPSRGGMYPTRSHRATQEALDFSEPRRSPR